MKIAKLLEGGFVFKNQEIHNEEELTSQKTFKKQAQDFIHTVSEFGDPFSDLNSQDIHKTVQMIQLLQPCMLHESYCNCTTSAILQGCHNE